MSLLCVTGELVSFLARGSGVGLGLTPGSALLWAEILVRVYKHTERRCRAAVAETLVLDFFSRPRNVEESPQNPKSSARRRAAIEMVAFLRLAGFRRFSGPLISLFLFLF